MIGSQTVAVRQLEYMEEGAEVSVLEWDRIAVAVKTLYDERAVHYLAQPREEVIVRVTTRVRRHHHRDTLISVPNQVLNFHEKTKNFESIITVLAAPREVSVQPPERGHEYPQRVPLAGHSHSNVANFSRLAIRADVLKDLV